MGAQARGEHGLQGERKRFRFRLFVAGARPQSARAISNLKRICERYLAGRYDLEIIDIYQMPELAAQEEILAVPALIKETPGDRFKLIGDLSNEAQVLATLGLEAGPASPGA